MSAIAGMLRFDAAADPGSIERMAQALRHRGPHGMSTWIGGAAALAHGALHTTPEARAERQPLANEAGDVVLVLDGRVDNREELAAALVARGARLRDATDAELVLRSYEAFGDACAGKVVGEFAFVVWDARSGSLFGARDALGTRHFYYHTAPARAAFASEIAGLLALGDITPRLNEARFVDSLVIAFDREDQVSTCYQGVDRLPAGHAMRIDSNGVRTWRWWDPSRLAELPLASLDECVEALHEQLRIAIACRLRGDVDIGAALSGGLDSSTVVGVAMHEFADRLRAPLKTFTLVHRDRAASPEMAHAACMNERFDLDGTVIGPESAAHVWRDRLDTAAAADEPFHVSNGYTDLLVCDAARAKGCKVLLDGMGGDLLFYWFEESVTIRPHGLRALPGILRAARRHGEPRIHDMVRIRLLSALLPDALRRWYRRRNIDRAVPEDARLLRPEVIARHFHERLLSRPWGRGSDEQEFHSRVHLSGLLAFPHEGYGQVAFSRGIEPRSPMSDRRLVEFALRMPYQGKVASDWYKKAARLAGERYGYLPPAVAWREDVTMHPGAQFRNAFVDQLVRHAPDVWNRDFVERTMSPWVDPEHLRHVWERHRSTDASFDGLFLLVLVLSAHWLRARFGA